MAFFDRLEANSPRKLAFQSVDFSAEVRALKRNISRLLNARRGHSQSAPSLGLADFNDASLGNEDLAILIKASIRECLLEYEPRLKQLKVTRLYADDHKLDLGFHIVAQVDFGSQVKGIELDLLLDSNMQYQVV